jgi:HrpA-like RNA helicase
MYARRKEITTMVTDNQVSIILGETGSGKSTQIAQYLYQAGFANSGLIVCTQPRKIAASSLATRVAQEMGTSVGNIVGYQVGMKMKKSQVTKIIYNCCYFFPSGIHRQC